MHFSTPRLAIRLITAEDLQASYEHRSCSLTSRYIGEPATFEQAKARLLEGCKPWLAEEHQRLALAITLHNSDKLIGELMFKYVNKESLIGEIGYRLHKDFIGQGYAFEAVDAFVKKLFEQLPVMKIIALCATENTASWRLMEKLGMQREGHLRSHFKLGDERADAYYYGLCRD
ncbi:GNAT family N-acetyltransferase [Pseudoalteromonas sp. JBTF-M23]|uniref:GNAT family N-acetyltransferase n=1 Tax=Pseudoalteromonas caenipelagi TaxID=2726988 RepID=A0A849VJM2_9GAMM|nr:GNAT family protein [Pseudoalteromonas caenipelagi]NOU51911.1 GNAT family N-acetyltransferase [Pseudoalteromonas caenipelagi]